MKVDTEHAEDRCVHETGPLSDGRVQPKWDMPKSWSVPGFLAENAHGADAVDQRVVHLDVDGEAVVLQPFDDVAFPRRPREIQRMAVQAGDQHAQLALAAGPGQGGKTKVEVDVEFLSSSQ